jgi:16S rRNA (uracil1498-N3)-methyltransferase
VELPVGITLFQGLPKSDKMDTIIQKAVELGAVRIVPVATERAVVKLDAKKAASKKERWQKISEAAAKQSKRAIVPEVTLPMTMSEAVNMAASMNAAAIPYELENGMDGMKAFVDKVKSLAGDENKEAKPEAAVFIGPEGGFADEEIELAGNAGIMPVSLGRRILRTETAGMTVLSILMYALETV